jgi:DNA polymerase-4
VERPSADEAYVDLTPEHAASPGPVAAVETVKDEIQRRLGLDCSLGLASSRLAARVASTWARPRGFLLVLPGYEALFLARQPLSFLPDLPPHIEACLLRAGFDTLGKVAGAEEADLVAAVGQPAAIRLRETARGEREEAVPVAAPPAWVQEESLIRDRRSDRATLQAVLEGLVRRACRRLRPFGLQAAHVTVEVRRPEGTLRRGEAIPPGANEEETLVKIVQALAEPLLEPASSARSLHVRLSRLESPGAQAPLFPGFPQVSGATR